MSPSGAEWRDRALEPRYLALRDAAAARLRDGLLEEARDGFAAALDAARAGAAPALVDRAFCNLAGVEIELGRAPETVAAQLRQILVDNRDAEGCRLAAYHLGRFYDLRKQIKKALFYARIAQERSRQLGNDAWQASSGNLTALLLLSESRFDEASRELERALALLPADDELTAALIMDNLGYCRFLQGRTAEGFRLCFRSLRTLRRLGRQRWAAQLTLAYGYLQVERAGRALRHGTAALAAAEREGDTTTVKNALFLLGEAANLAGDADAAYDHFVRLQREFYPEQAFLPNFLLAVDVTGLVNLKA
ncbi:MAG TPA: hypothetical protein VHM02_10670 [Thermoanaerobaculia bacterium]|nr:hypothetical protein [Thermoanaerobaculia bacterium]